MNTVTKPLRQRHILATKRPLAPLETVNWDTRVDFPPAQEVRTIRARFVEVPARPFEARPDPRD